MPTFRAALLMVPPNNLMASALNIGRHLSALRPHPASTLRLDGAAIPAMSTLRDRVEEAIKAGYTPTELARAAGKTPGAVSQWRSGQTKRLSAEAALGLESTTGWSAQWWTTGRGPKQRATPSESGVAHELSFSLDDHGLPMTWESVMSAVELPDRFCCAVPDDALAPRSPRGTRFTFERNIEPAPGLVVLVEDQDGNRYVRRYAQGLGNTWTATAAEGYAPLSSDSPGVRLVAVAVARWDGAG